jgi:Galactose oxidase-like, Early set domain/Bacterial Ig domain/Galactose oxidase, central domain
MQRSPIRWISLALVGLTLIVSATTGVSVAAAGSALVGDTTIEPGGDSDPSGMAEAFQMTATTTGVADTLTVYVAASSTAATLVAGLYADSASHPGARLTQGSLPNPTAGAWNTVAVPAVSITSGVKYWLTLLGAAGSGPIAFRDRCCGGGSIAENSSQSNLTSLPATWSSGARWSDGPVSFYAGASGGPTPTPPPTPDPRQLGQWSGVINLPLVAIHAITMRNGNVLMMDGWQTPNQTQVFNPSTLATTQSNNGFGLDVFCSAHVNLADGRVLVAGGDGVTTQGSAEATIFDPVTNTWSRLPNMRFARWYPTATELGDGRVVMISGQDSGSTWVDTPEIYDPVANTWTALTGVSTSQVHEPEYPLSYLLPSGKIFTIAPVVGKSFVLDPIAKTWGAVGGTTLQNGSAAMYLPGKILHTGGGSPFASSSPAQTSAQVIDLNAATPTWQSVAPMNFARHTQTLTVLPDGKVLAVGGSSVMDDIYPNMEVLPSEEWNPANNTWTTLASMTVPRMYHSTALLMPDGRVLVAGSGHDESVTGPGEYNAQFYSPPYLFNGARPTITSAPASATYGSTMTVQTPDAAAITAVSLVSLGSDSHTLDFDQHFAPLTFTAAGGALTVDTPVSANLAPPGYYMLFVLNGGGVPSTATMVRLGAPADTTPPTVTMTAPANGATVSGSAVALSASASDNVAVSSVQFLVDGAPIGAPVTQAPYTLNWDSASVANGSHALSARAVDAAGNATTSDAVTVTVANTAPVGPTIDTTAFTDGRGPVSASVSTSAAGDLLLAFVASDGPAAAQTVTVSGAGLSWTLVKRSNGQSGDAEIWSARAPTQLTSASVTATQAHGGYDQSLTVVAFKGAGGVGAVAGKSAASGAPSVALTTTRASSLALGVGNDYDNAIARTLGAGQVMAHQWLDTATGDTFWTQRTSALTGAAGSTVTINDTAPTGDRWNMSVVEVTGA